MVFFHTFAVLGFKFILRLNQTFSLEGVGANYSLFFRQGGFIGYVLVDLLNCLSFLSRHDPSEFFLIIRI